MLIEFNWESYNFVYVYRRCSERRTDYNLFCGAFFAKLMTEKFHMNIAIV